MAPVRVPTTTLSLLRRAAMRQVWPHESPWLHHAPNGIRV
jgi:hypothetical protein